MSNTSEEKITKFLSYPYDAFLMVRLEFVQICQQDELEAKLLRIIEKNVEEERKKMYQESVNANGVPTDALDITRDIWVPISYRSFMADLFGTVKSENTLKKALKSLIQKKLIFRRHEQEGRYDAPEYKMHLSVFKMLLSVLARPGGQKLIPSIIDTLRKLPPQELTPSECQKLIPSSDLRGSKIDTNYNITSTEEKTEEDRGVAASADNTPAPALSDSYSPQSLLAIRNPSQKGQSDATPGHSSAGTAPQVDQQHMGGTVPLSDSGNPSETEAVEPGKPKEYIFKPLITIASKPLEPPSQHTPAEALSVRASPPTGATVPAQANPVPSASGDVQTAQAPPVTAPLGSASEGAGTGGHQTAMFGEPETPHMASQAKPSLAIKREEQKPSVTQASLPDPPPQMEMTSKQGRQQNEQRAKEIWTIIEQKLEATYKPGVRKSQKNTRGMEHLIEDEVTDEEVALACEHLSQWEIDNFDLTRFHEMMPGKLSKRRASPQNNGTGGYTKAAEAPSRPAPKIRSFNGISKQQQRPN